MDRISDMICKLCNDDIEDEVHFLFNCCKIEHISEYYVNLLDDETQCNNKHLKLLCSTTFVLVLSKIVRRQYERIISYHTNSYLLVVFLQNTCLLSLIKK